MSLRIPMAIAASVMAALTLGCGREAGPPNVVFILADDLGWGELGSYGQTRIRTPHLDRLAGEGMRFTQHYSGSPVCAPSRAVLMTGRHAGRVEIRNNRPVTNPDGTRGEGQHPLSDRALTIARVFREAGYATGAMGKWGLGHVGTSGDPNLQGFDRFFGYTCQAVAHSFFPPHLWRDGERIAINENPVPGHARQPEGEVRMEDWFSENYAPDLMLAEAVEFLRGNRDRPFFLYLPFIEPHVAMHPPRDRVEAYPEEWDDRPYRGQCNYIPHPRPRAGYAAMITDLDAHVGRILATLDELGLRENTLVFFSSDNGTTHPHAGDEVFGVGGVDAAFFNSTAGLRGSKGDVYEGGIRVPLLARWPGRIAAGAVSDFPSYFPDHFATLCEVLGVSVPDHVDGVSLLPTLTGEGVQAARNPMVWVFPGYGGQVALRLDDWKAVRRGLATGEPGPWELYNLAEDPGETTDMASAHPEVVARAEAVLREQMDENPEFPLPVPGVGD